MSTVEVQHRPPQPVLSIRQTIPTVRYHSFGEVDTDLEIGVPVAADVAGEGRIVRGELPAGPAFVQLVR